MESNLTSKELSRRDLQRSLTNRYEKIQKDRDAKNAEKLAAKDKIIAAKDKDLADRDLQHKLAYEEAFNSGYNRGFKNNSPSNWKFWTIVCCVVIAGQLGFGIYTGIANNFLENP